MAEQNIVAEEVRFPGKAVELAAFVAQPASGGPWPVVIVIQEWWGLNDHIRDVARRFARQGYLALAPDLYSRQGHKVASDPNLAGELMAGLAKPDGVADLLSTVDWAKARKGARADRIGVTGYCMGGSYALLLPLASGDIKAAAPFYGEIPSNAELAKLRCPIFYAYGENDGWIQRRDVDRLAASLKENRLPGAVKVYAGCSHGFFNDTRKDVYRAAEARDAWERTLRLFADALKK